MSKLEWHFADRLALVVVLVGLLWGVFWFALPSSFMIREVSLTVEGHTVRFVRELPFGYVTARWRSEITLIDGDGFECNSGAWKEAEYQPIAGNAVTYQIGSWAERCLEAGPPFYLTTVRQAMLFGVIPMKPSRNTTEVQGERSPDFRAFILGDVEG